MGDTLMIEIRESITEHLQILVAREFAQYEGLIHKEQTMTETRGRVSGNIIGAIDSILTIPEIEEGQELLEKRDRLVELVDPQHQPQKVYGSEYDLNLDQIAIVKQMWKDGWRLTAPLAEPEKPLPGEAKCTGHSG